MSEMEKKEICTIEDHDTYSKDLEKTNIMESSGFSGYNESQDFRLVDIGDEESLDKSENEKSRNVLPVSLDNVDTTLGLTDTSVSVHQDIEKDNIAKAECAEENTESLEEEIEEIEKNEKDERNNDSGVVTSKSKQSDEEEEEEEEEEGVIECTPPEAYSSSNNKKQMVSNATTTNLKRKAESFDEPPKKLLKTEAKEDVVISKKKESEDEESCHSFKSDDSHQEFSKSYSDRNVIIAETQDTGDENAETMIEKISTNEEKSRNEKHSELEVKIFEIDKNENFNDASILNEAVANNKEEEEEEEEFSDTTNAVQLKENRSSVMKENDSSTSPIKMGTIEKMQSDSNNTGGIKLIDTCIKDSKIRIEKGADNNNKNGIGLEEKGKEIAETSVSNEITNESHSSLNSTNLCKSRNSIELIYDRTAAHEIMKAKPKEIVEIDEDGEKIVLDSSQEDSDLKIEKKNLLDNTKSETIYKSCYESKSSSEYSFKSIENTKESTSLESTKSKKLMNGSSESKRCDTDSTASLQSDTFSDGPVILDKVVGSSLSTPVRNVNKQVKQAVVSVLSKDTSDHTDLLLSVSDNEPDVFIVDDKTKSNLTHGSSIAKAVVQVEKEIGIYVRMKCLLHVDEGTKEFLNKEITGVQCETVAPEATDRLTMIRQKNNDTSASLADISGNDNKDTSPGSVNSNPQLYQLNPSRLSFASTISSLSSASSGASLTAKLAIRDSTHFSLPKAPLPKHARKQIQDMHLLHDKQALDEAYERLSKEWQNSHLLATTILNLANTELSGIDTTCNVSNERIDDQLQKIRSSTPEVVNQELMQVQQVQMQTPKSTKKNKSVKRQRSKSLKSADGHHSTAAAAAAVGLVNQTESNNTPSRKKNKIEQQTDSGLTGTVDDTAKSLSQMITDELIGKDVFAKWSDNNYYPGTVTDKVKTKYKVNFYDGKNKILIEDFVIPIPALLKEGLSVYATSKNDDYGSCGIIVDTETVNNQVYYIVETDEGEKLQVQVKNIFLTSDQAQLLKEEISSENKSLPSTPKHLGQITLDNMVDGKRRSKRIATPSYLTPKIHTPSKNESEPSVSGIPSSSIMNKKNKKRSSESSDAISSDSNVSLKDEMFSIGIQPEIIGTPYEQTVKGPQNRIKSIKSRSNKKKVEDEETIAIFGPIPRTDSNLFKGMSFILTCAPVETIDRFQIDNKDYGSDPGTENEEDWVKKPFIRDRLTTQIVAGGGKVYTDFNEIPREEYKNTKLITNVPNSTAKTLLCLSVGIPAYNHNWIIRCCQEGKIVNPAEDELPAGWSLDKQSYVEMFQRPSNKPFTRIIVIIPVLESNKQFVTFWRQICENAGACVLLADKPDTMENYIDGTVILTNGSCPSWTVEKAAELQIPLLSATWIVQCLIEGQLCQYDSQPRYKYNYNKKN
ncbi:uncharacterized protein LOC117610270 [Osmia lignaria lignaria]|uniref:uncharacterized protein LOC117610270 n=1 Tax=Osmia lignaria lignaria TaxID=1437193 RepID=UPI00402B34FB